MSDPVTRPSSPAGRDPASDGTGVLVVLPAYNEAESVGLVVKEVLAALPQAAVVVVDDGSQDATVDQARAAGAEAVSNPFNLGVGGAMRVGFRIAQGSGAQSLVQVDADGQHDPRDIPRLLEQLENGPTPGVVIGARFAGHTYLPVPRARRLAMHLLAWYLSRVTGKQLTDVTSGFRAHNRAAIELFARTYPSDYLSDTVESLLILSRAGGTVGQVSVAMRARLAGSPSQPSWRASVYLLRVVLMLALSVFRRHSNPKWPTPQEVSA